MLTRVGQYDEADPGEFPCPDDHPTVPYDPPGPPQGATAVSGGAVGLAHVTHQGEVLEEIRDNTRRQADAADRSAEADLALVELATTAWWYARTTVYVLGVFALLGVLGTLFLLLIWMLIPGGSP